MRTRDALKTFWKTVRDVRAGHVTDAPKAAHDTAVSDALRELDAIRDECRRMVSRRATWSAGAAVVPLPGLDIGTDVAILLRLLPAINEKFGLSPAQIERLDVDTKRVVMLFASAVGSNVVGRIVTRELVVRILTKLGVRVTAKGIVKFVPLLGQAVSAGISFGAMRLLGNRHVDDCYEIARRALVDDARAPEATTWEVVR